MEPVDRRDPRLEFDLADRMRRALRVSDVSVQDMAEYLDVSRGTVSTWINGRIAPSRQTRRLFALKTGVPLEWLETGQQPTTSPVGPDGLEPSRSSVKAGRLVQLPTRATPHTRDLARVS